MPTDTKENVISVTFLSNGDLVQTIEGADVKKAHYDRETGSLEYETEEAAVRLSRQILSAIGTIDKGTKTSGFVVKSVGIKGRPVDKPGRNIPPKPPFNPQYGEVDPPRVDWYFSHFPQQAYVKYLVFLDEKGEPIRRTVKRRLTELVDDREGKIGLAESSEGGKGTRVGPKSWEAGPIVEQHMEETFEDQIIARRPTPWKRGAKFVLFSPLEVVGGFSTGDDGEQGEGE